ncbi:hypothetical protein V3C99_008714 [Haemonchus contortus]
MTLSESDSMPHPLSIKYAKPVSDGMVMFFARKMTVSVRSVSTLRCPERGQKDAQSSDGSTRCTKEDLETVNIHPEQAFNREKWRQHIRKADSTYKRDRRQSLRIRRRL